MNEELQLLRKIHERTSDFVMASRDAEFAKLNGGVQRLNEAMVASLYDYERYMDSQTDCRDLV